MTTVADILKYVETLAPNLHENGLGQCGAALRQPGDPVTKVLVALDPFEGGVPGGGRVGRGADRHPPSNYF